MNLSGSSERGVGVFTKNMPTSITVSLAFKLVMYACCDFAMLFCQALAYAITADGVCLHLLALPLA